MVALARRRRLVSSSRARLSRALLVVVGRLQLAAIPLLLLGDLSRHRRRPGLVDDCLERDLLVMRCGGRWVGSAGYADVVLAPSLLFAPGALVAALAAGLGRVCTRTGASDAKWAEEAAQEEADDGVAGWDTIVSLPNANKLIAVLKALGGEEGAASD